MKLTPRLQAIAELIEPNTRVADVGSDHGYLAVYLHQMDKGIQVIASDVNAGPVENAKETLAAEGLSEAIDVRLGGGLLPYAPGETDIAVIAGMGGILIKDIIMESLPKVTAMKYLVLQPMTQQPFLRQWLIDNGFEIFNERFVTEGVKFYEIFCIKPGQMQAEDEIHLDIGFGKNHSSQSMADYLGFLNHKLDKFKQVKSEIDEKGSEQSKVMSEKLEIKMKRLEEVIANVR